MQQYELLSPAHTEARADLSTWGLGVVLALVAGMAGWWLAQYAWQLWGVLSSSGEKSAWYATRATATVAYLLVSSATVWGLLLSTKLVKAHVPAPLAMALHSALAWLGVGFGALHALLLLFDRYYTYTWFDLLAPFAGPYRPGWVGLGTISLYGIAIVSASFWARHWLSYRLWRKLHYLSFPVFVFVTLHGLMSGTDSAQPGARLMYTASALLLLFLTLFRLLTARAPAQRGG